MSNRIGSAVLGALIALLIMVPAQAGNNDWIEKPTQSFNAKKLKIEDIVGRLAVEVREKGPITLTIKGVRWKTDQLSVEQSGDELRISASGGDRHWSWKDWFNFARGNKKNTENLYINLVVPKGTAIDVDDLIGRANIGDTYGPMTFETAGRANSQIGKVAAARVSLAGSGKISVADVGGPFKAETAGSGDISVGNIAGDTKVEIAGSGSVTTGKVNGGIKVEIAGSGDFTAAAVNGPTKIEVAGSGSVTIRDGLANPFHVEIFGSGDISFGGTAVDPHLESMGSGNITIKAYRGNLKTEGNVKLKTGK